MGFKVFTGTLEVDLAWLWLQKMETIAATLYIPDYLRLPCAVQFLENHAYTWWKTIDQMYVRRPALTWVDFRREFEEKYYSRALREKKWVEFMNLR